MRVNENFQRSDVRNSAVGILTFHLKNIKSRVKVRKSDFMTRTDVNPVFVVTFQIVEITVARLVDKIQRGKLYRNVLWSALSSIPSVASGAFFSGEFSSIGVTLL